MTELKKLPFQKISLKEFSLKRFISLSFGVMFLYFGIFSFLVYPIMNMILHPSVGNILFGLVKIIVLSGIVTSLGVVFISMSFIKKIEKV